MYKHRIFFTHSSTDGYIGGLHVLAVVNRATLNIGGVCICLNYSFAWIHAQK